jgi:hypothetical protein
MRSCAPLHALVDRMTAVDAADRPTMAEALFEWRSSVAPALRQAEPFAACADRDVGEAGATVCRRRKRKRRRACRRSSHAALKSAVVGACDKLVFMNLEMCASNEHCGDERATCEIRHLVRTR